MITTADSLQFLKERVDYEFDINYSDPPYALGSEVIIRPDGKVDYKKANDFMNKWEIANKRIKTNEKIVQMFRSIPTAEKRKLGFINGKVERKN